VCIVGSVGLLAAKPALAVPGKALFRVQRTFLGAPFPAVTPGGAGHFINPVEPYKPFSRTRTEDGIEGGPGTGHLRQPGVADVVTSNPTGAKFTLPRSFVDYDATFTLWPSTAWEGYLSQSILKYGNFQGRFRPNNPYGVTGSGRKTYKFSDNYPTGTTTHGGLFDFSRDGYLAIAPGPNHFGGTMKYLYFPESAYYQYISYFNPLFFKGYGSFRCTNMGVDCTDGLETIVGSATSSGMVSRHLLGTTLYANTDPEKFFGRTQYRKLADPPAVSKNYYLHLNAPFTTGTVSAYGAQATWGSHPKSKGYDKQLGGNDLILTRTYTAVEYKGQGKTYYPTRKYYTKLTGVTRAVSLVKPRLKYAYQIPRLPQDPIITNYQANRVQIMKVFFLPEPSAILLLGSGIAGLAGLAFLRRR
jgi:hypothetical protein